MRVVDHDRAHHRHRRWSGRSRVSTYSRKMPLGGGKQARWVEAELGGSVGHVCSATSSPQR
jgi:hypothetical protein